MATVIIKAEIMLKVQTLMMLRESTENVTWTVSVLTSRWCVCEATISDILAHLAVALIKCHLLSDT